MILSFHTCVETGAKSANMFTLLSAINLCFYSCFSCFSYLASLKRLFAGEFSKIRTKLLLFCDMCKKKRQILLKNAVLPYLQAILGEFSLLILFFVPLWSRFRR